ncbi:MAG: hypothetical protein GEV09_13700 [Pseudonocardiaceae bacterium]|nr:hypothetical protein [Pseudonocardiaceae bacterium]
MTGGFRHQAVLYGSVDELATAVTPLLHDTLSLRDSTVLVVTSSANAEAMRGELGELADHLEWLDPASGNSSPAVRFDTLLRSLADRSDGNRRAHIVHEEAPGEDYPGKLREYLRYEAVTNVVFAAFRTPVLCLWDRRRYSQGVLDAVRRTHPELVQDGHPARSPSYAEPEHYLAESARTLELASPEMTEVWHELTALTALAGLRQSLQHWARGWGMGAEPSEDLVTAAHEVAANGLEHGAAPVWVRAWREREGLVCEVGDGGSGPIDPLAGYRRPAAGQARGRGLWLARQLADLVEVSTHPPGTRIRLHFAHRPGT